MNFFEQLQRATTSDRAHLQSAPVIAAALAGKVTRQHYVSFLSRAFHHVRHTPSLLMACGARLTDRQEGLRVAVAHYVAEELGHHDWILDDIARAGGDANYVRQSQADFDTDVMVGYAYDVVQRRNPVGLFGMIYVLEGTSVGLAAHVAAALQDSLGLPLGALTYLRSHGELDVGHMAHFEKTINLLESEDDKSSVEQCAKTMFRLYGNVLRSIEVGVSA